MFYAHFVLSKKGPLARVWLAAHWDKKLTKAHVFETNISNSVEAILEPKVKIALRTSGHLMLGVVRIYSRKAKYLLADCNEAFVKIKMAFRPGVVDLPEEHSHQAQIDKITLPDNFHDFESTINDINDIDMNSITVNQSRPEDITMREDFTEINLGRQEDDFGDMEFGDMHEKEVMRDASNVSEALYKSVGDATSSFIVGESSSIKGTPDKSGRRSSGSRRRSGGAREAAATEDEGLDDDTLQEAEDDYFGEWAGDDDDNEAMGMDMFINETADIFDDPSAMKQLDHIVSSQIESQIGGGLHLADQSEVPLVDPGVAAVAAGLQSTTVMGAECTTLVADEAEAFALPPIDTASTAGESMRSQARRQRKRRLIVDEQKSIPSEVMKSQMADTADIVATLDLAPPTKKLMMWKETGSVDKLMLAPGRMQISRGTPLTKLFIRHLKTEAGGEDENTEDMQEPKSNVVEPPMEMHRFGDMSAIQEESSGRSMGSSVSGMLPPPTTTSAVTPQSVQSAVDSLMTGADPVLVQMDDHDPLGQIMMGGPPSVLPGDTPYHYGNETPYPYNEPASVMNPPSVLSMPPPSVMPHDDEEEEDATVAAAKALEVQLEQEEANAMATGEADNIEDYEEKRLEKRGRVLLHVLKAALHRDTICNFKDLALGNNKKQAASKFYTLLALRKQDAVELQQTEPFADILVSRGPSFTALLDT